jgi:hypothetical protein
VNIGSHFHFSVVVAGLVLLAGACGRKPVPLGMLVLTQSPVTPVATPASDILDSLYPSGSRVVLMEPPFDPKRVQVLSEGLAAAGDPIVSYDGQRVFYAGKAGPAGEWQIYQENLADGRPEMLTSMPGGAMNPALLPDGSVIFASPVPKIGRTNSHQPPSALYVQPPGGQPRRLTFSSRSITDPTMLSDGKILFVSTQPLEASNSASGPALFTINNDGTEIAAFAGQEDPSVRMGRPRELEDGRITYVVSTHDDSLACGVAESVRTARPFLSRAPLFPNVTARIRSVQPAGNGDLLVCAENTPGAQASPPLLALFRVRSTAITLGAPIFGEPAWNGCEAVELSPHPRPMGRISSTDLTKQTGHILCLDANYTSDTSEISGADSAPTRVRVLAELSPGNVCALGELPVQADGSFMAEVPANVPLGFETLDENGRVLRREAPMLWVRPAENRSCIGCHEPRNRSPHNHRPLAVSVPITSLALKNAGSATTKSN